MATDVEDIGKAMTKPDGTTSGIYNSEAIAIYGTFNASQACTININHYTANDIIITDDPGSGYCSSYIFWFTI